VLPENNAAERAERHAVIWRRISEGTDSAEGSRFVERMLTVVATCRQQGRDVLDYLASCLEAARRGQAIPCAGDSTEDQSRLIPAITPHERLRFANSHRLISTGLTPRARSSHRP
jgi:hypothetical protein